MQTNVQDVLLFILSTNGIGSVSSNGQNSITISRGLAILLLNPNPATNKCLLDDLNMELMCLEYGEDDDYCQVTAEDYETIRDYEEYQTFEIWNI